MVPLKLFLCHHSIMSKASKEWFLHAIAETGEIKDCGPMDAVVVRRLLMYTKAKSAELSTRAPFHYVLTMFVCRAKRKAQADKNTKGLTMCLFLQET